MAGMGFKCYRLSIAWTRILPHGDDDAPNAAGVAFYRSLFEECKKYGIEPLVTICHFDTPLALIEKYGGWKDRRMVDAFLKYCKVLFENYGGLVRGSCLARRRRRMQRDGAGAAVAECKRRPKARRMMRQPQPVGVCQRQTEGWERSGRHGVHG